MNRLTVTYQASANHRFLHDRLADYGFHDLHPRPVPVIVRHLRLTYVLRPSIHQSCSHSKRQAEIFQQ